MGSDFGAGNQTLVLEVVVEGEGLDELLDGAAELALVAPAVDAGDVWDDGAEEVGDLGKAGRGFFGDGGRDRGVDGSDSACGLGVCFACGLSEGYRWREKILRRVLAGYERDHGGRITSSC